MKSSRVVFWRDYNSYSSLQKSSNEFAMNFKTCWLDLYNNVPDFEIQDALSLRFLKIVFN